MQRRSFGLLNTTPKNRPSTIPQMPIPMDEPNAGGGFMDFMQSPAGRGMLYGAGIGLLDRMNNPGGNTNVVGTALAGAQQFQQKASLNNISQLLNDPEAMNNPNIRRQVGSTLINSGDPRLMPLGLELAFPQGNDKKTTQMLNAEAMGLKPGTPKYNAYINQTTVGDESNKEQKFNITKFNALPADFKRNWLAYSRALGMSENKAINWFGQDKTLKDYAKSIGMSEEEAQNINPNYPPTTARLTQLEKQAGASAASEVLSPVIENARAPYITTIPGEISLQLNRDALSHDKDKVKSVAAFIGSQSLQIENAAAMFNQLGGNVSESAIENYIRHSPQIKMPAGLTLRPEHYREAAQFIYKHTKEAADASMKAGLGNPFYKKNNKSKDYNDASGQLNTGGRTYDPNTQEWS